MAKRRKLTVEQALRRLDKVIDDAPPHVALAVYDYMQAVRDWVHEQADHLETTLSEKPRAR